MTQQAQAEALRLAEVFERFQKSSHRWTNGKPIHLAASSELRSLHAQVQELKCEVEARDDTIRLQDKELARLQAQQAVRGYDSGIQTGNRVTLIFNTQEDATRWFEGFTDAYDAAHGTKSIALPIPLAAAPTPQTQEQLLSFEAKKQEPAPNSKEHKPQCWCTTCRPITLSDMRFVVCPDCGNKRCPRAHNHELDCINSNEPGQKGSSWEHVQPRGRHGDQS